METEYSTSIGYKIFYGLLGAVAIVAGLAFFNVINKNNDPIFAYLFPLVMLAGGILIFVNLFKRKVVITADSITYAYVFKTVTITFDQVKGFRFGDKVLYIEPAQQGYSKIRIGDYSSIEDYEDLRAWISTNFKDLDKVEYEEEKEEILHDVTLGATEADRQLKFDNTKKYSIAYSIGGIALFFVAMVLHRKMYWLSYILLTYPLVGVLLIGYGKGLIRLVSKKSSAYSSIFTGLLFPGVALVIQGAVDTEILSYQNVWVPFIIIGLIMLIALYFVGIRKFNQQIVAQVIISFFIAAAYGFGSTMQINCVLDQSKPEEFTATVINHHITHGKSTTYHVILSEWGQHHESDNISVSSSFYDQAQIGTQLKVEMKKGVFNIPWYYLKM